MKENGNQNKTNSAQLTANSGQKKQGYYTRRRRYYKYRKPNKTVEKISFKKLSIIIPLLDEEDSLRPLINEINKALLNKGIQYEVLFIDDGSKDNSLKIIKVLVLSPAMQLLQQQLVYLCILP